MRVCREKQRNAKTGGGGGGLEVEKGFKVEKRGLAKGVAQNTSVVEKRGVKYVAASEEDEPLMPGMVS
jgi:hypothetical protein